MGGGCCSSSAPTDGPRAAVDRVDACPPSSYFKWHGLTGWQAAFFSGVVYCLSFPVIIYSSTPIAHQVGLWICPAPQGPGKGEQVLEPGASEPKPLGPLSGLPHQRGPDLDGVSVSWETHPKDPAPRRKTQGPRWKGLRNHLCDEGGFYLPCGPWACLTSRPSYWPVVEQGHTCRHEKGTEEQQQRKDGFSHSWGSEAGSRHALGPCTGTRDRAEAPH